LLLDTHALLWWLAGDGRLSRKARVAMSNADQLIFVSAASAWEITTKYRIGKLAGAGIVARDVASAVASQAFSPLAITLVHAQRAGSLLGTHRDPLDRMLIAQSQLENLTLVSNEKIFDDYGVTRLW
jgi:PIN domain nuclease of toxin-antitoxin system